MALPKTLKQVEIKTGALKKEMVRLEKHRKKLVVAAKRKAAADKKKKAAMKKRR